MAARKKKVLVGIGTLAHMGGAERQARYFWPGCHRMEPYRTTDPTAREHLTHTEKIAARVVVLPTGQAVDESTATRICSIIERSLQ